MSSGPLRWYGPSVTAVRWLLGVQYLCSGLGWWISMLPFPNVWNWSHFPQKHPVAGAMIETGWMYHLAKATEVATGLALVTDQFAALMLVVSMPVALTTFLLDAMIGQTVQDWIAGRASNLAMWHKFLDLVYFGGAVLAMQGYLMVAYLDHYRPMLARKARIMEAVQAPNEVSPLAKGFLIAFAVLALFLGLTSTPWMVGMINQWAIPWSSLSLLAPPH